MLARCARCQGTFQTDRFGVQTCPHCGGEVHLADPSAAPGAGVPPPPPPASVPPPPEPGPSAQPGARSDLPPPPPPPSGGYGPPPGGFGGGRGPGGPGPSPGELPAPFADRAKLGFFRAYFSTWKLAAVEPGSFFGRVRIDQTGSAILFGVISSTIGGWAQAFWTSLTAATTRAQMRELASRIPPELAGFAKAFSEYTERATSSSSLTGQALLAPIAALVGIFVSAAVLHALLVLVRGANRGFNATLTVVGYATGLSLLQLIPECGAVVLPFWIAVVLIIGLSEAHRCGTGKGAAAVLLPIVLVCGCICVLVAMAAAGAGLGAAGGAAKSF